MRSYGLGMTSMSYILSLTCALMSDVSFARDSMRAVTTPSWTIQDSGTTANLTSVVFVDQNRGWAVGSGGIILHYEGIEVIP